MSEPTITEINLSEQVKDLQSLAYAQAQEIESLKDQLSTITAQAEENDEIFNLFLKNCPIYVFFKDSDIRVLRVSSNFNQLVGYSSEYMVGKSMYELFPAELARSMEADDKKVLENGVPIEVEEEFNGRFYYTLKFPITRINKKPLLAGFTMDITERKQAEEFFKQNSRSLEELNDMKDKLFTVISHDLRNSFNSIIGFSELLRINIDQYDNERIQEMANHINVASKNTYALLSNLLDWAKNHLKQFTVNKVELDVIQMINGVIDSVYSLARKKSITIVCLNTDSVRVESDINMLSTVLRNLITNAIKYSHKGGEIQLLIQEAEKNHIISVKDFGIGMSDKTIEQLFTSTLKDSKDGTLNEKGSGLGLLLCKEFVEKQGGKLWVESVEGEGSTFKFTLPKAPAQ